MTYNRMARPLIRYFNEITDIGDFYEKRSINVNKLVDEFHFLSNIPESLQKYYPPVSNFKMSDLSSSYEVLKVPVDDASQFLLSNDSESVNEVLAKVRTYLNLVPSLRVTENEFNDSLKTNILEKNLLRLKEIKNLQEYVELNKICQAHGYKNVDSVCLKMNETLNEIFRDRGSQLLHFSHGDLCFSNILLHGSDLFFIDPKGYSGEILNTYRPICYDLAKLSQCLNGRYDFINNELFEIRNNQIAFHGDSNIELYNEKEFLKIINDFNVDIKTVRLIEASLFFSLIPHHRESRKKIIGFLINSLNIFNEYLNITK